MVEKKEVREQLKQVIDPELDVNIVDLGLIYEIEVDEQENIDILMTLTTPGCPLHGVFDELVKKEVNKLDPGDIEVELTFEPRWTPEEMSDEARNEIGNIPGMNVF
ncbi:MAG: FeS assembly SUF system protein [Nanohaloarchaea archaeon SW_4_43_9]|nr:MAG: FeS assembly SUF system protein [Nanohaloarchaea archaeon SW_4_43_9]